MDAKLPNGLTAKREAFALGVAAIALGTAPKGETQLTVHKRVYPGLSSDETRLKVIQDLLKDARIAGRIEGLQNKAIARADKKFGIDAERVIAEQGRIGFAKMTDYVTWGTRDVEVTESKIVDDQVVESKRMTTEAFVDVIDSDKLSDDQAAAVAEVSMAIGSDGRRTVRLKLAPKAPALAELADILGMKRKAEEPPASITVNQTNVNILTQTYTPDQLIQMARALKAHVVEGSAQ